MTTVPDLNYWVSKNARWREVPTGLLGVYAYRYEPVATTLRLWARHYRMLRTPGWTVCASMKVGRRTVRAVVFNAPSRFRGAYAALSALSRAAGRSVPT